MRRIVAASEVLVVGEFGLHQIKLLLTHNGRNLGHCHPLLRIREGMASMAPTNGNEGRLPMLRHPAAIAPDEHGTGVDRIGQDTTDGGLIPAPMPTGSRNLLPDEALGDPQQTLILLLVGDKHLCDDRGFGWLYPHPCRVARTARVHSIAIGRVSPGHQSTRLVLLLAASSHAFGNQATLILGHCSADL